jgi:hypothetical protein
MMNRVRRIKELASFLYAQRVKGFEAPDHPHMDAPSYERFMALLRNTSLYLEFGSGGSTVEAARLGIETICVESDRFYAKVIRDKIGAAAPVKIIDADIGETEAWGPRSAWRVGQTIPTSLFRMWRRRVAFPRSFSSMVGFDGPARWNLHDKPVSKPHRP